MHQPRIIIGWDLGGAHLKAVAVDANGVLIDVRQMSCPLWKGTDELDRCARAVLASWQQPARHVITMTGELADSFSTRDEGVYALVASMQKLIPGKDLRIYAGRAGMVAVDAVGAHLRHIASANWLATACYTAQCLPSALLVDIGSTTSDVLAIDDARLVSESVTDADRLACEELVYTGVVRTPVRALASKVPFRGHWQTLVAEHFSTSADVYRLLARLPEDADQHDTPDGRGKSIAESAARLARMLGLDCVDASLGEWHAVAAFLARRQLATIHDAADRVLSAAGVPGNAPLIGAGVGRFLAKRLALLMGRPYHDFGTLLAGAPALREAGAVCAPAAAVALLEANSGCRGCPQDGDLRVPAR